MTRDYDSERYNRRTRALERLAAAEYAKVEEMRTANMIAALALGEVTTNGNNRYWKVGHVIEQMNDVARRLGT